MNKYSKIFNAHQKDLISATVNKEMPKKIANSCLPLSVDSKISNVLFLPTKTEIEQANRFVRQVGKLH